MVVFVVCLLLLLFVGFCVVRLFLFVLHACGLFSLCLLLGSCRFLFACFCCVRVLSVVMFVLLCMCCCCCLLCVLFAVCCCCRLRVCLLFNMLVCRLFVFIILFVELMSFLFVCWCLRLGTLFGCYACVVVYLLVWVFVVFCVGCLFQWFTSLLAVLIFFLLNSRRVRSLVFF